ncbi:MAG: cation diffusion facilitator family transporter [Fibrobacterota bacterium]
MHHHSSRQHNIKVAVFLNVFFTIIEIVGGVLTNSLAILSDALHDLGDSIVLIISLTAEKNALKPADARKTYGYQRLSLLSAVSAGIVLFAGSVFILYHAVPRLANPQNVEVPGMIGIAILGVVVNFLGVWRLKTGHSQNEKVLSLHLLEDVLGWVVILIGSIVMYFWHLPILDPLMTIGITVFILFGVIKNLKSTIHIFLQGVPEDVDISYLKESLQKFDKIIDVHDIHVWSLEGETNIFTGHIVVDTDVLENPDTMKKKIKQFLKEQNIGHSTIEFENKGFCSGIDCENNYAAE